MKHLVRVHGGVLRDMQVKPDSHHPAGKKPNSFQRARNRSLSQLAPNSRCTTMTHKLVIINYRYGCLLIFF